MVAIGSIHLFGCKLEVMRKMQFNLTKLSETAHEAYNVVRETYRCWIPCCAFPAEQIGVIEECAYQLVQSLLKPADLATFQQTCNTLVKLDTASLSRDFQDVLQLCYGLDQLQEVTERLLGTTTFQLASTEHKDPVPVVVQQDPRACCV